MPFKMHKVAFLGKKKISMPTLPKILRLVTQNKLIFYLALPSYPELHIPVIQFHTVLQAVGPSVSLVVREQA